MPHLFKTRTGSHVGAFWSLSQARDAAKDLAAAPVESLTSDKRQNALPDGFYDALGFMPLGQRIVRLDMLERLADVIRTTQEQAKRQKAFQANPDMMSIFWGVARRAGRVLTRLGYQKLKSPAASSTQRRLHLRRLHQRRHYSQSLKHPKKIAEKTAEVGQQEPSEQEPTEEVWWRWGGEKRRPAKGKSGKTAKSCT